MASVLYEYGYVASVHHYAKIACRSFLLGMHKVVHEVVFYLVVEYISFVLLVSVLLVLLGKVGSKCPLEWRYEASCYFLKLESLAGVKGSVYRYELEKLSHKFLQAVWSPS